ncbi:MAG: S1 RNA-binding domain-containing protein, partial [Thermaurantiacus sp.]
MTTRMLIDARHPEETRVVVLKGQRLEEFDFEAEARKQIRGNIYLAKVTRVEPSLQAAFIDYGGNRHGFLPFSEIHPDYYQIPREDREALLREESRLAEEGAAAEANGDAASAADSDDSVDAEGPGNGDSDGNDGRVEDHGNTEDAGVEALRRQRMALRRRYKIQE